MLRSNTSLEPYLKAMHDGVSKLDTPRYASLDTPLGEMRAKA